METKPKLLSLQAIFNRSYRGLAAQGFQQAKRATHSGCAYRGISNGKKARCAIGQLIPQKFYNPEMEGAGISWLERKGQSESVHVVRVALLHACKQSKLIADEDLPEYAESLCGTKTRFQFLRELQNAHDTGYNPQDMQKKLREVAERFNLRVPKLQGDAE